MEDSCDGQKDTHRRRARGGRQGGMETGVGTNASGVRLEWTSESGDGVCVSYQQRTVVGVQREDGLRAAGGQASC